MPEMVADEDAGDKDEDAGVLELQVHDPGGGGRRPGTSLRYSWLTAALPASLPTSLPATLPTSQPASFIIYL